MSSSTFDRARNLREEAYKLADRNQRTRNFLSASKLYLAEIDNIQDRRFQEALAFLAKTSLYESLTVTQQPIVKENTRTDDEKLLLYNERAIEAFRQQRLNGLHKIPKGSEPSPNQVLIDIQSMEKALSELGLKKPPPPRSANEEAKKALGSIASMLGESYMVLNEGEKDHEPVGLDYSMITLPTIDMQHVPQHQRQQLPPKPHTKPSNLSSEPPRIPPPQPYHTSIIPFWSTPTTTNTDPNVHSQSSSSASTSSSAQDAKKLSLKKDTYHSAIEGLDWNTQSFMPTTNDNSTSNMSMYGNKHFLKHSTQDDASIQRLLKAISKLKEENAVLQSHNKQVTEEMSNFRHEYEHKLQEVKQLLKSNSSQIPTNSSQATPSSSSSTSSTLDVNKLNEALEVALRREKKYQERQAELTKVIMGLTKKYDNLSEENLRKDALIQKLQQSLANMGISNADNSQMSNTSNLSASNGIASIGLASPGNRGASLPVNPAALSSSSGLNSSSLLQQFNRRAAASARHPSTSTLESLQKSTKNVK